MNPIPARQMEKTMENINNQLGVEVLAKLGIL